MNSGENNIHALITSASLEAKGGIVALHRVLFGQPFRQNFRTSLFPVSSAAPFDERWISRIFRIVSRIRHFIGLLRKDNSINVIHINTAYDIKATARDALFILISRLFKIKTVIQIHSTVGDYSNSTTMKWIAKNIFSLGDKILVFTREDMKNMQRLVPEDKVDIFPNAVRVKSFQGKDNTFRKDQSIPEDAKIILFVARFIKEKGVYDLIEAIPLVARDHKNVCFLFAGEGPEKSRMETICREKGLESTVRFPGHLQSDRLIDAFSCADVFVLPTYHGEGMPMAILEALAAGLPIVSTPCGAIPDIVKDGVNGFLIEPHAPEQISEKLGLLLRREDMTKRIRDANLQLARSEYDRDFVLEKLEKLYSSL
jgi:glycosyltransferase involved in cell wall biosynthesis